MPSVPCGSLWWILESVSIRVYPCLTSPFLLPAPSLLTASLHHEFNICDGDFLPESVRSKSPSKLTISRLDN